MLKQYALIFFISMVPLIELRAAVPIAIGLKIPIVAAYVTCIIGNMLPVPIIYLFARKVLEWGKEKPVIGKFFTFCLEKGEKGGRKLRKRREEAYMWLCFCSWEFRFREQEHGPEHWQQVF